MKIIDKSLILIDSTAASKDEIIDEILKLMTHSNRTNNPSKLLHDIFSREAEASTSMGLGIAIPHAQSDSVIDSSLVFIKLKHEIIWDNDPVRIVFGIFVSNDNVENIHLKILSSIARKLISEEFRNKLLLVNSNEEAFSILNEVPLVK